MFKLVRTILIISILFALSYSLVNAEGINIDPGSGGGSRGIDGSSISQLGTVIQRVIYFLFGIIGGVAIIMIVVGGIKYIASNGDPKTTASAKQTIQFAILGLVIVLLAVVIVNIVGGIFGVTDLNVIRIGSN